MKTLFMVLTVLIFTTPALAQSDDWGWQEQRKNRVQQQYNPMEDRWETTKGDKTLHYNALENEWSYQDRGAYPTYNPMEDKWEYPK